MSKPPGLTVIEAVSLLFLLIFLQVLGGTLIGAVAPEADLLWLSVLILLSMGAVSALLLARLQVTLSQVLHFAPYTPGALLLLSGLPLVLTTLGASIVLSELDNGLRYFYPMPPLLTEMLDLAGWNAALLTLVVAPLTEELLFRGLILRGFLSHYSAPQAILNSAILFSLFHLNPYQLLPTLLLGLLLGWLYLRAYSLWPCLLAHALFNFFAMFGLFGWDIPGYSSTSSETAFQPLWFDLGGLLCLLAGLWLLLRILRPRPLAKGE